MNILLKTKNRWKKNKSNEEEGKEDFESNKLSMNNSLNIEKDNFSISFRKEFEEIINYLSEIENFEITKFLNNLMIEIASTTTPKGFNDLVNNKKK